MTLSSEKCESFKEVDIGKPNFLYLDSNIHESHPTKRRWVYFPSTRNARTLDSAKSARVRKDFPTANVIQNMRQSLFSKDYFKYTDKTELFYTVRIVIYATLH